MPDNNKAGGICIRCEAWTKSYIGVRTLNGSVLCKHCSKARTGIDCHYHDCGCAECVNG